MSSPQRKRARVRRASSTQQTEAPREISLSRQEPVPADQLSDESLQELLDSIVAEHSSSEKSGSVERAHQQRRRPFDLSTIFEEPSNGQSSLDKGGGECEAPAMSSSSLSTLNSPALVEAVEIHSPQRSSCRRSRLFRRSELSTSKDEISSSSSSLDENRPTYPIQLFRQSIEFLSSLEIESPRTPEGQTITGVSGGKSELALTRHVPKDRHTPRPQTPSPSSASASPEQSPSEHPSSARGSGDNSEGTSSLVNYLLGLPSERTSQSHEDKQYSPRESRDSQSSAHTFQDVPSPIRKTRRTRRSSLEARASPPVLDLSLTTLEGSYFQPPPSFLHDTFNVFLLRKGEKTQPKEITKPQVTASRRRQIISGIDPILVGPSVVQTVLREDMVLRRDEERPREGRTRCSCDVKKHPRTWTREDLAIERERVVKCNGLIPGMRMYNVRMTEGDSWKRKAEQVLKYIDVELGIGDQTIYDSLHYIQPLDRMIVLILMKDKIIGLVVAEKINAAYQVLLETRSYRELDLNSAVDVKVGINKLWVHVSLRKHKLATRLCEVVRWQFFPNETLLIEDLAFNYVSEMGLKFAKGFLSKTNSSKTSVLLYMGKTGRRF